MRKFLLLLLVTFISFPSLFANRGDIISAEVIRDWDQEEAREGYWNIIAGMVPEPDRETYKAAIGDFIAQLMAGKRIVSYKVIYETIDHYGNPTRASGLVLLPVHNAKICEMPIFYYGHGTIFDRYGTPSRPDRWNPESFFNYLTGALNFISVAPDYYGMGDGPGFHHHCSAQTNSTSGIDIIRAARKLATQQGIGYNSQVYISGYSEGGHNAMALIKMVKDQNLRSEFNIISAGCGSGPYDLSDLMYHFILNNPYYPTRQYIFYLLATCDDIYKILDSLGVTPSYFVAPPYDSLYVAHILSQDGNYGWVPTPWTTAIQPGILEQYAYDPNNPLRSCLRQSDVYDWPNPFRTSLYYVKTDSQVYYKNAGKAKLAQWKYIPWYRFWEKARIATHDMTNKGEVKTHEEGAVPIMAHYILYSNMSKIMSCTDSTGRSANRPEGFELNYDKTVNLPAAYFPDLKTVTAFGFSDFTPGNASVSYDAEKAVYRIRFPEATTGGYILRLTDGAGKTTYSSMVYTEPEFLEDAEYSPISRDIEGNYLLDMTLLEDKVSRVNIYLENGAAVKSIDNPYAIQQLAAGSELPAGDYAVEIVGRDMRYYLRMPVNAGAFQKAGRIFPNPFNNVLQIEGISTSTQVQLFSMDGRLMNVPVQLGSDQLRLNTAGLPASMYLLQITGLDGTRTEKVVKQD